MTPKGLIAAMALAAGAVWALWSIVASPDGAGATPPVTATPASTTAPSAPDSQGAAASAPSATAATALRDAVPPPSAVPLGSNELPDLRADAAGRLVMDAHTRDELEKLLALNDRAAALALLRRLDAVLPPVAYRQAVDAFYAYQNYSIAAAQLTSPAQPVTDEAGASQQLDALHALRVQQLGAEVAQAWFGDEEATARRLIAEMRTQSAGGSTLAERAEQAQRTVDRGR